MGTETRSQVGKANVLIISVILVVLLSISNAWFLYANQSLQNQVSVLKTENSNLQNEIETFRAPQLHEVDVQWADHQGGLRQPAPYISIEGSIFNSGSEPAYNTILTVRIFDNVSALLKSEEIHLGTVTGKSYNAFDVDIQYSGRADSVTTTITYD